MQRTIYDEDHESFRASAREFVERELAPRADEMIRDHVIPRDIWEKAGAQGFFGLCIPEEYGGAGVDDYRFNAVFGEECGRFTNAVASSFGIHADITAPYIVHLGTEAQKQRWLPDVAAGNSWPSRTRHSARRSRSAQDSSGASPASRTLRPVSGSVPAGYCACRGAGTTSGSGVWAKA